uniref:Uncharacterized protein n=1 Tax=Glossina pallidipes TaxID=7398 RepID=A0A1B0A0H9_GLOPL
MNGLKDGSRIVTASRRKPAFLFVFRSFYIVLLLLEERHTWKKKKQRHSKSKSLECKSSANENMLTHEAKTLAGKNSIDYILPNHCENITHVFHALSPTNRSEVKIEILEFKKGSWHVLGLLLDREQTDLLCSNNKNKSTAIKMVLQYSVEKLLRPTNQPTNEAVLMKHIHAGTSIENI